MASVTFYHSVICPRCKMAGVSLSQLLPEFPEVTVDKVDILTNRGPSRAAGVKTIPTMISGEKRIDGFYLTKKKIRGFLESL
jgi:glutaredoxin